MKCAKCQNELPDTARFCLKCGALSYSVQDSDLSEGDTIHWEAHQDKILMRSRPLVVPPPVAPSTPPDHPTDQGNAKKPLALWVAVGVVVVGILAAVLYSIKKPEPQPGNTVATSTQKSPETARSEGATEPAKSPSVAKQEPKTSASEQQSSPTAPPTRPSTSNPPGTPVQQVAEHREPANSGAQQTPLKSGVKNIGTTISNSNPVPSVTADITPKQVPTPPVAEPVKVRTNSLAVLPFRVPGSFEIKGRNVAAVSIGGSLRDGIVSQLVQSHKFTVVDSSINESIAGVSQTQDPVAWAVELARKAGIEYALIGTFDGFRVTQKAVGAVSIPMAEGAISIRVIEAATKQILLAKSIKPSDLTGLHLESDRPETFIVDAYARTIAEGALDAVHPLKVLTIGDSGQIVIDRGGDGIAAGDRFDLFTRPQENKESSASVETTERKVGSLEIVSVSAEFSTARLLEKTELIQPGTICRKVTVPKPVIDTKPKVPSTNAVQKQIQKELDDLFK